MCMPVLYVYACVVSIGLCGMHSPVVCVCLCGMCMPDKDIFSYPQVDVIQSFLSGGGSGQRVNDISLVAYINVFRSSPS